MLFDGAPPSVRLRLSRLAGLLVLTVVRRIVVRIAKGYAGQNLFASKARRLQTRPGLVGSSKFAAPPCVAGIGAVQPEAKSRARGGKSRADPSRGGGSRLEVKYPGECLF